MLTIHAPSLVKINLSIPTDSTHLSLGYVAQRMKLLALLSNIVVKELTYPDIYRSEIAYEFIKKNNSNIELTKPVTGVGRKVSLNKNNNHNTHISIASWTDMRLNAMAVKNIAHCFWEQKMLATNKYQPYFGSCMVETLRSFDTVWACSKFLATSLLESGIKSVINFPTPIVSPQKKDINRSLSLELNEVKNNIFFPHLIQGPDSFITESTKGLDSNALGKALELIDRKISLNDKKTLIFTTQGNPGDRRKGLISTMIGFSLFAESYSGDAYLFVKTSPRTQQQILEEIGPQINEQLRWGSWGSNKIIFLPCNLSDDAQYELYSLSDFYICCPVAEGQNIPLQEAIQCGCYPISPLHTAMSEYLISDLMSPIPSRPQSLDPLLYCGFNINEYIGYQSDYLDIADACQRAVDTSIINRNKRIKELQENFLKNYTYNSLIVKFKDEIL